MSAYQLRSTVEYISDMSALELNSLVEFVRSAYAEGDATPKTEAEWTLFVAECAMQWLELNPAEKR